jgi:hypothetical protein
MKRFLLAVLVGLAVALIITRLSRRPLLSEELSGDTDLEDALAPGQ